MRDNFLSMQDAEFWKGMTLEVVTDGTEVQDDEDHTIHVVTDENSVISGKQVYMTQPVYDACMEAIGKQLQPLADAFVRSAAAKPKKRKKLRW